MTAKELIEYLARDVNNRLEYIGPAALNKVKKLTVFEEPIVHGKLVSMYSYNESVSLREFLSKYPEYFKPFEPKPTPIFVHVFYGSDGLLDHTTSTMVWDHYRRTTPGMLDAKHVDSQILWRPE